MRKGKLFLIPLAVLLIIGTFFAVTQLSGSEVQSSPNSFSQGLSYNAVQCTEVIRADGSVENLGCSQNTFFNQGANNTRDYLGNGVSTGPMQNISLCNATAGCASPIVAGTETFNKYTTCGLSDNSAGTYATTTSSVGNWSINRVFTATCDGLVTNVTRLSNATGSIFAGNSFTSTTLQTNDQLNLTWYIWVAEG